MGTFLRGQPGFETKLAELRLNRPGGMRVALEAIGGVSISGFGRAGQPTVGLRRVRLAGKQKA